ncbi:MAG: flavodoxin family protein [Acidobacteriota bacterium]|jgi:flavodoxin|nr:flavodoxin family protein [Acidobacteriota bacterium]
MKVLITYYSQTGNTEKIARAIYEAAEHENRFLAEVEQAADLDAMDLIFVGFPIMYHSVPGQAARLIQRIPAGKSVAIFATHGSRRGGKLAVEGFYHAVSMAAKLHVLGTFGCQGKVNMHLLDELSQRPEYRGWLEEARGSVNHPDAADLADAHEFASAMMGLAHRHKG